MATDPQLIVALTARLDAFEKGLKQAGLMAEREIDQIERAISGRNLFVGLAQGFGQELFKQVEQIVKSIPQVVAELSKIGELSTSIGLTTEEIQVMRLALDQSGVSAAQADNAMRTFAEAVRNAATGSGELHKWLEKNNIAVKDAVTGGFRPLSAVLKDVAELIRNARTPQDQLTLATAAFGHTAGPAMVQTLRNGAQGLEEFGRQAHAAGQILGDDVLLQAEALNKEFKNFMATTETAGKALTVAFGREIKIQLEQGAENTRQLTQQFLNFGDAILTIAEKIIPVLAVAMFTTREKITADIAAAKKALDEFRVSLDAANKEAATARQIVPFPRPRPGPPTETPAAETDNARSALERYDEQLAKHILLLNAENQTIGASAGQKEFARQMALLLTAAERDGIDVTDALTLARLRQAATAADAVEANKRLEASQRELNAISREVGSALAEGFKSAVLEGKKLDEVLRNLIKRLASQSIDRLFALMFAPPGGFNPLAGAFSFRQAGGPVTGGQPYVVGERGAEIFVPNTSGRVIPNARAIASGAPSLVFAPRTAIDARGSSLTEQQFKAILAANNRAQQKALRDQLPGLMARQSALGKI